MRALALLVLLAPLAAAAPAQVHLGLPDPDASTARSVLWLELDPTAPAATLTLEGPGGPSEVQPRRVEGPSLGTAYEALLDDLEPDATYSYRVGDAAHEFRTPPTTLARPFRIVALGDMGVSERAQRTVDTVLDLAPDLVLHMGDISYAEGRQVEWATWFEMVEPVAARVPWVTALGNHETYGFVPSSNVPSSQLEIGFYKQRFGLPGNELWYSFDWAGVHFIALDTFSQQSIAQEQVAWLAEDLAAHADAAWTIVFLHEPPWSSNAAHGSKERVQDAFGALFEEHGVDLVLSAHDHSYERTHPIGGVTYIVSGGAGQSLYEEWEPKPSWSAARGAEYHVLLLDVGRDRIEGGVVLTQGGDLDDAFTIARDGPGQAPGAVVATQTPGAGAALAVGMLGAVALLVRRYRRE